MDLPAESDAFFGTHAQEVARCFGAARARSDEMAVVLLDSATPAGSEACARLHLPIGGVIVRAVPREFLRGKFRLEEDLFDALGTPSGPEWFRVLVACAGGVGVMDQPVGPAIWTRVRNADCIDDMLAMGLALPMFPEEAIEAMIAGSAPDSDSVRQKYCLAELWVQGGLARVALGHKHAAALMATSAPPEVLNDVRMPWPVFAVAVPDHLLSLPDGAPVVNAFFWREEEIVLCSAGDARDLTFAFSGPAFAKAGNWAGDGSRVAELLMRLFTGIVLELNEHRPTPADRRSRTSSKKSERGNGEPLVQTVTLKRDVKVDARAAVRDYCEGRTPGSPSVRRLVRGHWKNQAHGPGQVLRKKIFVEPYWQGPEEGAVAMRTHTLADDLFG